MREPLIVVTSDCHLNTINWARYPELRGDSFCSFRQIIDYCLHNDLPLLIAGDVTHKKNPDAPTVGFLFDQMTDMAKVGLRVMYIEGQHELSHERPWLDCHEWPIWLHRTTWATGGLNIRGINYTPADRIHDELKDIPVDTDVLVAHQVWLERMGIHSNPEAAFADVPYAKMLITGDFHGHRVDTFKNKDGNDMTVVSPGSTYMRTLDEDHRKFFFILYNDLTVESVPIETRPVLRTRIGSAASLEKELEELPKVLAPRNFPEIAKPIWHVEYFDDVPDVAVRMEQQAKGRAHLFLRPIPREDAKLARIVADDVDDVEQEAVELRQGSLEEHLPQVAPPDSPQFKTALRLLRSKDHVSELNQITEEARSGRYTPQGGSPTNL